MTLETSRFSAYMQMSPKLRVLEVRSRLSSMSQQDTSLEIAFAVIFTQWLSNQGRGRVGRKVIR
jgi:hypothetical protein